MPILFSEFHNISGDFEFFDIFLDIDVPYFIDPKRLDMSESPELNQSREKLIDVFSKVIISLKKSDKEKDRFWVAAEKLLNYKEVSGTGLGYAKESQSGAGIGEKLRKNLLRNMKELISKGEDEPVLFELVCVFEEGLSFDRLSDLVTALLIDEIILFNQRIAKEYNIPMSQYKFQGKSIEAFKNPYRERKPLFLIPHDILSPLPQPFTIVDISSYLFEKEIVTKEYSEMFNQAYKKSNSDSNKNVAKAFYSNKVFRDALVEEYLKRTPSEYDFEKDPAGYYKWYSEAKRALKSMPLSTTRRQIVTTEELHCFVEEIIEFYRSFIESQNGWRMLYNDDDSPRTESSAQLLFYGVVSLYCEKSNVDINREVNNGRGPVDFKLSQGNVKVIIEFKLSSNKQLSHALDTQVPIYMKQENLSMGYLVIVKVNNTKKVQAVLEKAKKTYKDTKIRVIIIDALSKKSASVA